MIKKFIKGYRFILIMSVVVIAITVFLLKPESHSYTTARPIGAVLILNGRSFYKGNHPSVWKFNDGNRLCYITTGGGIWCVQ